jgi:hypothetical protein
MKVWALLAGLTAFLCMSDGVVTALELEHKLAVEANPVMASSYTYGMPFFFLVKVLACALLFFLAKHERHRLARIGILLNFAAYACVMTWHAIGLVSI